MLSTLVPRGSRVHAWSASPHPRRSAACSPRRRSEPSARSRRRRSSSRRLTSTSSTSARPNHLHLPLAEAALAAGKHVICEKPLAVDDRGAEEMVEAAASAGRVTAVPFVYRYYPTVREARERIRTGVTGPVRLIHGGYLQDWLLRPSDDNWRVDEHARRRVARVRRHRLALVRPGRVRLRAPHHARERPPVHVCPRTRDGGRRDPAVRDRPRRGRQRGHQPDLRGAQEPARRSRSTAPTRRLAFNQEEPEELWVGRRENATLIKRDPGALSAAGRAPGDASRRPPAGLQRLLRRLRRRRLRRGGHRRGARRPAGLPRRPARRAHHRRGARLGAHRDLGRRARRGRPDRGDRPMSDQAPAPADAGDPQVASSASRCCTASTSTCAPARSTRSWARTAPASRR